MADDVPAAPPPPPQTEIMFCTECGRARVHVYTRLQARSHVPQLNLAKGQWFAFWKCQTCGYSSTLTRDGFRFRVPHG